MSSSMWRASTSGEGLLDVEEETYDRIMDTNLKGLFFMSQTVAREMYKRKTGHIINIGSHNDEGMLAGARSTAPPRAVWWP